MTTLFKTKDPTERTLDAILSHEIRKLNTHLPKQRRTMSDLMKSTDPTIEAVDGTSILLRTVEMEELSRIVPIGIPRSTQTAHNNSAQNGIG